MDGVLHKPFTLSALAHCLAEHLSNAAAVEAEPAPEAPETAYVSHHAPGGDHEPVDPSLRDADAPITKAQVERFFALKYPQYEPLHDLDPLFTDERFFTALENNIHWRDHGVTVDLRPFYKPDQVPPAPGATVGLSGAVTGSGN